MQRLVRWVAVTLLLAALVVVTGWAGLRWVVPHYRPALHEGERYAIDVSVHQGDIDWSHVADDGIAAAYVKASEGRTFTDDRFAENWTGAHDAGLEVGAYHFFTLCNEGEEQAANLLAQLRTVGADADDLPPVADLELSGNCSDRPAADVVAARLRTFVEQVEAGTGQRVRLYVLDTWTSVYPLPPELADRERWTRRLLLRPAQDDWAWWQVSSRASVAGIEGPVDLDVVAADPG